MKSSIRALAVPGGERRLRAADGTAFLPAALEIVETPPSPTGRAISFSLIGVFCIALAWASLGQVDVIASAQGRIVPSGRTKTVQPFENGVIGAIHVRDGQRVNAGDVLIELDPTINGAELRRLQSDLAAARLDVARLRAALADGDPQQAFHPPADASGDLVAIQRQLLADQTAEQQAKIATLDRQGAAREAEIATYNATIAKLDATIPLLRQRVEIRQYLAQREIGSKISYLENLTELVQQQKELGVQQSQVRRAEAALAAVIENRAQAAAEYRRARLGELAIAEAKAAALAEDVVKASEHSRLQILKASEDGIVQQLSVHTIGGVVTAAQPLLELVPLDSRLEIEAMVPNKDVGFVRAGQSAEIKVDTFNFTKYGLLHGTVLDVSADSIDRRKPNSGSPSRLAASSDSEPQGHELVYAAHVSLEQTGMQIDGKEVPLAPGMAVTVEIKTGEQRVIDYLLSPLLRFKQESLRER